MTDSPETLYEGRFLSLKRRRHWEFAARTAADGAVAVVAVTPADRMLLVEQYRPPCDCRVIELPAGLVGDTADFAGESWRRCAERELWEETGYRADRFERLTAGPTTPGLSSETVTLVRAVDLTRDGPGGGDAHEDIRVHEVPPADVHRWLGDRAAEGIAADAKVYAGLYFLLADH